MSLFVQINESADEHIILTENVLKNTQVLFEGFSDETIGLVVESAAKYLGTLAAQLKFKRSIADLPKAIDMLTALRVLGSSENRDAFNVRQNTFKVLIQKAGEDAKVDAALSKLSHNPSVASVRKSIEAMLNAAMQSGDNEVAVALSNVNKLRLGYERVQNILQSSAPKDGQSPDKKGEQQGPVAAWTNPQKQPAAPQNSATPNSGTTAANG